VSIQIMDDRDSANSVFTTPNRGEKRPNSCRDRTAIWYRAGVVAAEGLGRSGRRSSLSLRAQLAGGGIAW
jgi:hypothetical protein